MKTATQALILGGLFSLLSYSIAEGADWVFYMENKGNLFYYDKDTVTVPSKSIVKVEVKMIPAKETITEWIAMFGDEYAKLHHVQMLFQLKCPDKKYRYIELTSYASDGSVIATSAPDDEKWKDIPPDSAAEVSFKAVCLPQNKK